MDVHENAEGTLVVTYDGTVLPRWLFGIAAIFVGTAAYDYFLGPRGTERLIGLAGATATCVGSGLLTLENTRFSFDPLEKTIVWSRRWGVRRRSGVLRFDQVAEVMVQTPIGDEGTPSRRISLRISDAGEVPITVGYRTDADNLTPRIAERIRRVLGQAADVGLEASLKTLVASGRVIDAIKILREQEGLSLSEAKRRIDALKIARPDKPSP